MEFLPEELIEKIMSFSGTIDILNLGKINNKLFNICQNPLLWSNMILHIRPTTQNLDTLLLGELIKLHEKLTSGGTLLTCGKNEYGQLGLGNVERTKEYYRVVNNNNNIIQVSAGSFHLGYITKQGQLYMCGNGNSGELGLGYHTKQSNIPIPIPEVSDILQVSCGNYCTAFITSSGQLYTFGNNLYRRLLLPEEKQYFFPTLVKELKGINIIQVSCGEIHMGMVDDKGKAYLQGLRTYGYGSEWVQNGLFPDPYVNDVKEISCGENHTLFLTKTGEVYSCGNGSYGQLGFGDRNINLYQPKYLIYLRLIKYLQVDIYRYFYQLVVKFIFAVTIKNCYLRYKN